MKNQNQPQNERPSQNQIPDQISIFSTALLSILEISAERQLGPIEFFRRTIREEISNIVFKALAGVALTSTIIYAILQAGDAFQVISRQYENGPIFELIVFGLLAVGASVAFGFLFKSSFALSVFRQTRGQPLPRIDYEAILLKFAEGFLEGLESPKAGKDENLKTIFNGKNVTLKVSDF